MSDNVIPIYDGMDLPDFNEANSILDACMCDFREVLIIGYDHTGDMDMRATCELSDKREIVFMLERFKLKLLNGDFDA